MHNRVFQQLTATAGHANWLANTDVTEEHTGQRIGAQQAKAAFTGNTYVIEKARELRDPQKEHAWLGAAH